MKKLFKWLPMTLFICIVFLSVGFASFSNNISISDISASVRNKKDIRVTNFYAIATENGASSTWEEYSSEVVASNVIMPNIDSTISYKMEITNLGNTIMMIDDITGLPDNMTYEIEGYDLKKKICDPSKENDPCKLGIQKEIVIKLMYKENAEVINTNQLIQLNILFDEYSYKVNFDANGGTGTMDAINLKYDEIIALPSNIFTLNGYIFDGWNTAPDGSGTSYSNEEVIQNINTNEETEITLYAQWTEFTDGFYYPGYCIFKGQGNDIEGECAEGQHIDYLDTGVQLFSEDNYQRNFILSFTIKEISDSAFTDNNRDTIFNALLEEEEGPYGKYPGLVLRTEGNKWFLQASKGQDPNYATKILFDKDSLINKEVKIIRINDDETIKIYYMIGDNGPYLLKDITDLYSPFDTTLTFGASIDDENLPYRYSITTLKDIYFEFLPDGTSLVELTGSSDSPVFTTVFSQEGKCEFHGKNQNITGDNCALYWNFNYIDTGIPIFGSDYLSSDFEIYFELDSFDISGQEDSQATIFNAFKERTGLGYGIILRKNRSSYEMIARDGSGKEKKVNFSANKISTLKIIKKGDNICYSINYNPLVFLINVEDFYEPFENPVTFGSAINKDGAIFRNIVGEMSNMYIRVGKISDDVICYEEM